MQRTFGTALLRAAQQAREAASHCAHRAALKASMISRASEPKGSHSLGLAFPPPAVPAARPAAPRRTRTAWQQGSKRWEWARLGLLCCGVNRRDSRPSGHRACP